MERASAFPKTPDQICSQWALNEGSRAGLDDRNGADLAAEQALHQPAST
jgi:hypothetical protein